MRMTHWLFGALSALSFLAGCQVSGNPDAVRIVGNAVAIRQDKTANLCFPNQSNVYRAFGTMDLAVASATFNRYVYYAQIENLLEKTNIASQNTTQTLRSDSSSITLQTMTAELVTQPGTKSPIFKAKKSKGPWTQTVHVDIKPQGIFIATVPIITPDIANEWATLYAANSARYTSTDNLVIRVKLSGTMADSTPVESAPIDYPVTICWGCLLNIPVFTVGPDVKPEDQWRFCSKLTPSSDYLRPCIVGQDDYVDCADYCQQCTAKQSNSPTFKCDPKFCPQLNEDDFPKKAP
jgi:hypothetical protein